jgi:hypothetical protein
MTTQGTRPVSAESPLSPILSPEGALAAFTCDDIRGIVYLPRSRNPNNSELDSEVPSLAARSQLPLVSFICFCLTSMDLQAELSCNIDKQITEMWLYVPRVAFIIKSMLTKGLLVRRQ